MLLAVLGLLFFLFYLLPLQTVDPGSLSAISAILINADTGTILYEKNIHELRSPASIAKIATCAYAIQQKGDQLQVQIETPQDCIGAVSEAEKQKSNYSQPAHWLVKDACHIGIKKGEIFTLKDLLYGMMIASADDASNIIAYHVGGGSIPKFIEGLNQWIASCGCKNTTFTNAHGLYHPAQRTTAFDMALIAKEAMKNPLFREIVRTTKYTRPKTNKQESTLLVQTNQLLRNGKWYYPYATGIKTGKIEHSGHGLVSSAQKNDRSLISVVLGCKGRADIFKESIQLFEAAFNEPQIQKILFEKGPLEFTREIQGVGIVKTILNSPVVVNYYPSEEPNLTVSLTWEGFVPPLLKGEHIGTLHITDENGKLLTQAPVLVHSIEQKNFFNRLFDQSQSLTWKLLGGTILLLILIAFAWRLST